MMIADEIEIRVVADKKALKEYIYLPQKIYASYQNWVPPIYMDEWKFHDPKHNKSILFTDTIRLIAYKNNQAVGRIMGIIHKKYNEQHDEQTARFFQLDCMDDVAVSHALIHYIENWAIEKGMNKLIGPFGYSDKDPEGLQIEGFEYLPIIATPTNPPYLQQLVEAEGFTKKVDCVSYKIDVPEELSSVHEKIFQRICQNKKLRLIEFNSKKQLKPYIVPVFRLINETYAHLFGFVPMTEDEMQRMAVQYMPVLDPAFVKVVMNENNELIAFVIAMPDMSVGIQKAKGKLFPFGFIHILNAAKKAKQLNLLLGAVKEKYRGLGIDVLMGQSVIQSAIKRKFIVMDSHLVLETNKPMCAVYENMNGIIYKRYRVYQKDLC